MCGKSTKKSVLLRSLRKETDNMFDFSTVRVIEDFPTPGIKFYDITTLLNNGAEFRKVIDDMVAIAKEVKPDVIVALESRGFFFGPAIAHEMGLPFVPVRKKGKLPSDTYQVTYTLEYGTATVEIHKDALKENQRVLIVDDVLATGGSMNAAVKLVDHFHPSFISTIFLMEISALKGRKKLSKCDIHSLVQL